MKRILFPLLMMLVVSPVMAQRSFIHYTSDLNIAGNTSTINNALLDNKPGAQLQMTKNWNPNGTEFWRYNDHVTGLWFDFSNHWSVYNDDLTDMIDSVAYNIFIPSPEASSYVHIAEASTILFNYTVLDHPDLNGDQSALIFVTHNWQASNIYNDKSIGVWYTGTNWSIYNQDQSDFPENAAYNIYIPSEEDDAFVHRATLENTFGNYTLLDHPSTNGNPNAILIVTQNWNPIETIGIYNEHIIGVWYDDISEKWSVFNQDHASMPEGASFNVLVVSEGDPESVPRPWMTQDIGDVDVTGFVDLKEDTFLISGSGTDIWGTEDAFRYVYQEINEDENVEMTIRVASIEPTNAWAKAGVMIRQSLDADSKHATTVATPGFGTNFQYRLNPGEISVNFAGPVNPPSVWLRIAKEDGVIKGFASPDGAGWEEIASLEMEFTGTYYAGLALASHHTFALSNTVIDGVDMNITGIDDGVDDLESTTQNSFSQLRIQPNPASEQAQISFIRQHPGILNLSLYTLDGKLISTLADGYYPDGKLNLAVNLSAVDAGLYLVVLRSDNGVFTKRLFVTE